MSALECCTNAQAACPLYLDTDPVLLVERYASSENL